MSEQVRARRDAERAADRLDRLQRVGSALASALTPQQVGDVVVTDGLTAIGAAAGIVTVLDEGEGVVVSAVGYPEPLIAGIRRFGLDAPIPLATALREGEPLWLESEADWVGRWPAPTSGRGPVGAAVPLHAEDRIIGAVGLRFDADVHAFEQSERDFSCHADAALRPGDGARAAVRRRAAGAGARRAGRAAGAAARRGEPGGRRAGGRRGAPEEPRPPGGAGPRRLLHRAAGRGERRCPPGGHEPRGPAKGAAGPVALRAPLLAGRGGGAGAGDPHRPPGPDQGRDHGDAPRLRARRGLHGRDRRAQPDLLRLRAADRPRPGARRAVGDDGRLGPSLRRGRPAHGHRHRPAGGARGRQRAAVRGGGRRGDDTAAGAAARPPARRPRHGAGVPLRGHRPAGPGGRRLVRGHGGVRPARDARRRRRRGPRTRGRRGDGSAARRQ